MYWCKSKSTNVKLSEEHTDSKWVTTKEALEIIKKPNMQADINAYVNEKIIRSFLNKRSIKKEVIDMKTLAGGGGGGGGGGGQRPELND